MTGRNDTDKYRKSVRKYFLVYIFTKELDSSERMAIKVMLLDSFFYSISHFRSVDFKLAKLCIETGLKDLCHSCWY